MDLSADEQTLSKLVSEPGLHGARRVWTSPAVRCRGLAEAIARSLSAPLSVDHRLWELDFGAWEGQAWATIDRADLDRWAASLLTFAPPGGESGAELIARIREFHVDLRRARQDCVVVSHGGPLKVLHALLVGGPIDLLGARAGDRFGHLRDLSGALIWKTERRDARDNALAEGLRSFAPRDDAVVGQPVAHGHADDVINVDLRIEVADDIGPLAGRRQRDRAWTLADGKALDRSDPDIAVHAGTQSRCDRIEQQPSRPLIVAAKSPAGDADESRDTRSTWPASSDLDLSPGARPALPAEALEFRIKMVGFRPADAEIGDELPL